MRFGIEIFRPSERSLRRVGRLNGIVRIVFAIELFVKGVVDAIPIVTSRIENGLCHAWIAVGEGVLLIVEGRFFFGHTILHEIEIHEVLCGHDGRPTIITIVVELSQDGQFVLHLIVLFGCNNFFRLVTSDGEGSSIVLIEFILLQIHDCLCSISSLLPVATVECVAHLDGKCSSFGESTTFSRSVRKERDGTIDVFVEMCPNFSLSVTRHLGSFGIGEEIVHDGHATIPEVHASISISTDGKGLSEEIVVYLLISNFGTVDVVHHVVATRNQAEVIERCSCAAGCPCAVTNGAPSFPREVVVSDIGSCIKIENGVRVSPSSIRSSEKLIDIFSTLPRSRRTNGIVGRGV